MGNVASCREAFQKIQDGFKINEQTTLRFLYCLEQAAVRGHIDGYTETVTHLSPAQNTSNIFKALAAALETAREM